MLRSNSKLKNFGENNNFRLMGFPMSDLTWSSLVLNLKVAYDLLTFSNFWSSQAETYPLSWSEYSPWHHHPQPIGLLACDLWVFKACCKIFLMMRFRNVDPMIQSRFLCWNLMLIRSNCFRNSRWLWKLIPQLIRVVLHNYSCFTQP